ncbi:MAG: hypothetical protein RMK18_11670 [Armatimonadota bacterium]|nr:hypothetical protein [Armatimonadota bacterium]MDW8026504.1 hypothetical protein [Armatimonadota bacterium]
MLRGVARQLPISFSDIIFYDAVSGERRESWVGSAITACRVSTGDAEVDSKKARQDKAQQEQRETREPPAQTFSRWQRELSSPKRSRFAVVFHLDKLIAYRQTGYIEDERQTLLWMEKVIENVTPNHRLVVALQDAVVPIELYTNSPKTYLLLIPMPDEADKIAYLKHRLGENEHFELIADLTDALFLRDLNNIANEIQSHQNLSTCEVRQLVKVNKVLHQRARGLLEAIEYRETQ